MKYLTLYIDTKPVVCIDTSRPTTEKIRDALYYAEKYNSMASLSNYKNIYTAKFRRTAESFDSVTSRQIVFWDIPKMINGVKLIEFLQSLKGRSCKDKRKMNPKSLENLKPARRFTPDDHPTKPRLLTEEQLDKAEELRKNGCSWKRVGDLLNCNCQTVRSSLRRRLESKIKKMSKLND